MLHIRNISANVKKIILIFVVGILVGGILYMIFHKGLAEELSVIHEEAMAFKEAGISRLTVFCQGIMSHGIRLMIFLLFVKTKFGKPYMIGMVAYIGLTMGFIGAFYMGEYGIRGLGLTLMSYVPQCITLIPAYVLGYKEKDTRSSQKIVMLYVIEGILLMITCVLEACINMPMMQEMFS